MRADEVEPLIPRATAYLRERRALEIDGQTRPEMRELAGLVKKIRERVRYVEVRAMLDEVAATTAVPILPFGMERFCLQGQIAGSWHRLVCSRARRTSCAS